MASVAAAIAIPLMMQLAQPSLGKVLGGGRTVGRGRALCGYGGRHGARWGFRWCGKCRRNHRCRGRVKGQHKRYFR